MFEDFLDEQDLTFVQKATEFGNTYLKEENVARWYEEGGIPYDVMETYRLSDLGYLGFSPALGGPQVSSLAKMAAIGELTRIAGTILPFQSQFMGFNIISKYSNESQQKMILDKYEKTSIPCFSTAISDSETGSDLRSYRTKVINENGRLILSGEKVFVSNGAFAPYILVMAKNTTTQKKKDVASAPPSFWLIPANLKGISIFPINKIGQRMVPFAATVFDNVEIKPEWQLKGNGNPSSQFQSIVDIGRCAVCAGSAGLARAAYEDAIAHANTRAIRGKTIGHFQQIGLLITNMASTLVSIGAHIDIACRAIDRGEKSSVAVALMKSYVPAAAHGVADMGMQILGGAAYSTSIRMSRIWIDSRGGQYSVGTDQVMANIAARGLLDRYASGNIPHTRP